MIKADIEALIIGPGGILRYLSQQAYAAFTREDRELLREVVTDQAVSYADYEARMVSLFPKKTEEKTPTWREE